MSSNARFSVAFNKTWRYFTTRFVGVITFIDVELSLMSSRIDVYDGKFPRVFLIVGEKSVHGKWKEMLSIALAGDIRIRSDRDKCFMSCQVKLAYSKTVFLIYKNLNKLK